MDDGGGMGGLGGDMGGFEGDIEVLGGVGCGIWGMSAWWWDGA